MATFYPRTYMLLAAVLSAGPSVAQDPGDVADSVATPVVIDSTALPQAAFAVEESAVEPDRDTAEPAAPDQGTEVLEEEEVAPEEEQPERYRAVDPLNASAVGLRLSYFYYHELFPLQEVLDNFRVDRIEGEPKSAEYGVCEGLYLEMIRRLPRSEVFLRPKLSAFLGLLHRYNGSTQPDVGTVDSERVAVFYPADGLKNNYFLNAGLDIGSGYLRPTRGAAVWSGLGGSLWKRSLWGGDAEYYYWFELPVGLWAYATAGRRWKLGLELSVDFMLGGWMKLVLGTEPGQEAPDIRAVRLSDGEPFGRRASVNVALPLELRTGPGVSVRFVPWFEYYHFGKSNEECLAGGACDPRTDEWFYEPASRTFIWGLGTDIVIHRRQQR
jgi:hypothetical protein